MWVEKLDPAGVREPRPPRDNRYGENAPSSPGMAGVWGNVPLTDGAALDARLEEIAATMCGTDPRTTAQRRADALIALAAQQTRLHCGCGWGDCPVVSADATPLGQVVLHVLADQGALTGAAHAAGYLPGVRGDPGCPAARAGRVGHGHAAADPATGGRTGVPTVGRDDRVRAGYLPLAGD